MLVRPVKSPLTLATLLLATVAGSPARSDFTGLAIVVREFPRLPGWTEQYQVLDVHAVFTEPTDTLLSVGGTDAVAFATTDPSGFFNAPLGSDGPPDEVLVALFPELTWDSFVTIGIASTVGLSPIIITQGVPPIEGQAVFIPDGEGWASSDPDLGISGNYPDNTVLIARLTQRKTASFGMLVELNYLGDGDLRSETALIELIVPTPDCNVNGVPDLVEIDSGAESDCNLNAIPDSCEIASGDALDCNGNGLPDTCDITSGTSTDFNGNGIPDECEGTCEGDIDGDSQVAFSDLLAILGDWGPCPGCATDLDGDGEVSFTDLLAVLAAWGPCP